MQMHNMPTATNDRECTVVLFGEAPGSISGECVVDGGIASYDRLRIEKSSGELMDVMNGEAYLRPPIFKNPMMNCALPITTTNRCNTPEFHQLFRQQVILASLKIMRLD